jgi:hypothetical protein
MAPAPVPSYAGSGPAATGPILVTAPTNNNNNNANSSSKIPRRTSGKSNHSRSYPRGVGLDFRKLAGLTLVSYIDHHGALLWLWSVVVWVGVVIVWVRVRVRVECCRLSPRSSLTQPSLSISIVLLLSCISSTTLLIPSSSSFFTIIKFNRSQCPPGSSSFGIGRCRRSSF